MSGRIAFVQLFSYGYFNPDTDITGGGAERQLYLLSQELKSEFDVHFVVGDYGQPSVEQRDGITLHRAYKPTPDTKAVVASRQLGALFSAMRSTGADVFILRGSPRKAIATYGIARLLGAKWVYNLANDSHVDPERWADAEARHRLFEFVLGHADGIIAQTPHQQTQLSEQFGVDSTVVPNGYPPATDTHDRGARSYFLWVGRLNESQKQPHRCLDLAAQLPDQEFRLVGPARDEAYLNRLQARIDDLDNVQYLGPVDPDEIHSYYRDAIAVVNTSAHEGFPNTFLEAWRLRTPVLSLHVDPGRFVDTSLPECYADGDFETFVTLAETLATDAQQWDRAATSPHEYFEANLTIEGVADRYGAVLNAALSGR